MTCGTRVSAGEVSIGERVLKAAGVPNWDSDHHIVRSLTGTHQSSLGFPPESATDRVCIADVFIGARSKALEGVSIGGQPVVGAGSVVVSDVPPDVIAAGDLCRVLGPSKRESEGR